MTPRVQKQTARVSHRCATRFYNKAGQQEQVRLLDGGKVPGAHTGRIVLGERHGRYRAYGEEYRICGACLDAAELDGAL